MIGKYVKKMLSSSLKPEEFYYFNLQKTSLIQVEIKDV